MNRDHSRVSRPPGPSGMATLARGFARRDPTEGFERIARDHGRLAYLRMGPEHVYVLSHPELVHELFVLRGRSVRKGRALEKIKVLLGEGLLTSEGELHRTQRRLIQPTMHGERIRQYEEIMAGAARELSDRWRTLANRTDGTGGLQVDVTAEMSALTLTIIGRVLSGKDLADEQIAEVADCLRVMLGGVPWHLVPGADWLLSLPLPSNKRKFAAVDRLDRLVNSLIDERRTAPASKDLLSALLRTDMSAQQVRDETLTLLLAGHETTANSLSWAWWLLATNPGILEWLREELEGGVDRYAPPDSSGEGLDAGPEDGHSSVPYEINKLPRTHAVIAETLRLYPPSWILGRRVTEPVVLDGWTLPERSLVVTSQWALHRDPRFWTDPADFRPARWLGADGAFDLAAPGQPKGAYLPFGMGSRTCVGREFAWSEAVLVLATLAREWTPRPLDNHPVRTQASITLRARDGITLTMRPSEPRDGEK